MNAGSVFSSQSPSGTPASTKLSSSNQASGFGTALTALSAGANQQIEGLSSEQTARLQELSLFLQTGSLSDLEGGLQLGRDILLDGKQLESHPFVNMLLKGGIDEASLGKLADALKEMGQLKEPDENGKEENDQSLLAIGGIDLLSIMAAIARLSEEQLQNVDLQSASNVVKFAKIQELLTAFKDMSADEAALSSQLKSLLEKISSKVEQLLENDSSKKNLGAAFEREVATGNGRNTEWLKRAFSGITDDVSRKNSSETKNSGKEFISTEQTEIPRSHPVHFQISKLEQFVLTTEKGGQPVNQEQFIKAFENILNKANFTSRNGMQKLFIKLNPEHLGSLRIELIQKDAVLIAKIVATTAKARDLLESQVQGLKHALNGQNLQIEKIEISQSLNAFTQERFLQRDSDRSGPQQQTKEQQQNENHQEKAETEFTADLEAALLNMEA
ncbi:flagellar hook-length control protein FliK [Peribacillus cavernae]|uniref:Flagellar hook-length control protein FliK n=1 Tax=Peribacillus cavernae TaxID=1674310 RepID=A0A3S0VEG3_9BACI|nr:flagellar hook-length control protein FliK [Peribacillus cavernae]MDQ0217072.1 flagellar hook-length control protein FliK [Peribacillus cavernae]RUQ30450.1 flagellar hook-length control protein FliK [Peribacillus cavernae]